MASDAPPRIMPFADALAWEQWLSLNHRDEREVWLQIAKKDSGIPTVSYDEALDVALCYGWIDGQRKSHDTNYFIQRFTPRRAKGLWSKRNVAKVAQLSDSGRMQPAGLAEVEAAQRDGRWEAAYDSPKDMLLPEDFLVAVQASEKAHVHLQTLGRSIRFGIAFNLHKIKRPETRVRRIATLVAMLERGESPR